MISQKDSTMTAVNNIVVRNSEKKPRWKRDAAQSMRHIFQNAKIWDVNIIDGTNFQLLMKYKEAPPTAAISALNRN